MTFSIDGATAASYVKYRREGTSTRRYRNLRFAADEKSSAGRECRSSLALYLFNHNDSEGKCCGRGKWRRRSGSIGCAGVTRSSEDCSRGASFQAHRISRASSHEIGTTTHRQRDPGATPRAEIESGPLPLAGLPSSRGTGGR